MVTTPYVRKLGEDAVEAQSHHEVAVILTVTATMRDWPWARRMSRLAKPVSFRVNLQTRNEVIRMRAQHVGSDVIAETNEADVHLTQDHGGQHDFHWILVPPPCHLAHARSSLVPLSDGRVHLPSRCQRIDD